MFHKSLPLAVCLGVVFEVGVAFGAASLRTGPVKSSIDASGAVKRGGILRTSNVQSLSGKSSMAVSAPDLNSTARLATVSVGTPNNFNKSVSSKMPSMTTGDSDKIQELNSRIDLLENNQDKVLSDIDLIKTEIADNANDIYNKTEIDKFIPTASADGDNMTWTDTKGNFLIYPLLFFNRVSEYNSPQLVNRYVYHTNTAEPQIYAYVNRFCNGETEWWCYISGNIEILENGNREFVLVQRFPGYGFMYSFIQEYNGRTWLTSNFYTNEQNPAEYIRTAVCEDRPEADCYVSAVFNMLEINNNISPGLGEYAARYQVNVMSAIEQTSGKPRTVYQALR